MRMTCNLPDHASVVEALLEGFVRACMVIIEAGLAPADPMDTGVRYQLEPAGEEDWKLPQNVIRDGWGDCEDLAGWRAAGLRVEGVDQDATVRVARTGANKLHAVVLRGDGSIDDPSLELYRRQSVALGARPPGTVVDHRAGAHAPAGVVSYRGRDGTIVYKDTKGPSSHPGVASRMHATPEGGAGDKMRADFGRGTRQVIDEASAEAKGFVRGEDGAWRRKTRAEVEAQQDDEGAVDDEGYDDGGYDGGYDDGDGGWGDDGTWVDPRAVAAFREASGAGDDEAVADEDEVSDA